MLFEYCQHFGNCHKDEIKQASAKSDFNKITDLCIENEIELLPITFEHIQELNKLEFHHKDPFDRLIIAQGIAEKLTVLTKDENFRLYQIECFW